MLAIIFPNQDLAQLSTSHKHHTFAFANFSKNRPQGRT